MAKKWQKSWCFEKKRVILVKKCNFAVGIQLWDGALKVVFRFRPIFQ